MKKITKICIGFAVMALLCMGGLGSSKDADTDSTELVTETQFVLETEAVDIIETETNNEIESEIDEDVIVSAEMQSGETENKEEDTETTEAEVVETVETEEEKVEVLVWIPKSGSKYHFRSSCSNMKNPTQVTLEQAIARGV